MVCVGGVCYCVFCVRGVGFCVCALVSVVRFAVCVFGGVGCYVSLL